MTPEDASAYARLLLDAGLQFSPGRCLAVSAEPIHWPFLNLLAEEAYRAGARYVDIDAPHPRAGLARIDHAPVDSLDFIPPHRQARIDTMLDGSWSRLAICGEEEPGLFANVDQSRYGVLRKAVGLSSKPLMDACGAGRVPWCVAALPTDGWAARVLDREGEEATSEALWAIMRPILRLDREDPSAAWRELAEASVARCRTLNDQEFATLHFAAPGTNLTLRCIPEARWEGGTLSPPDGPPFIPNLPTEEVFTTPDWRGTEGRAAVTRPVEVMGKPVIGAWFSFQDGQVVDYGAEDGLAQLDAYFAVDERSRYLGEAALVDGSSPIFQSGRIFHNILYDENAACHIALGSGYPLIPQPESHSPEEQQALGINQSLVHTDFMIGCPEIDVTGTTANGREVAILRQGAFVPPFA